jgi:hypothetical protein
MKRKVLAAAAALSFCLSPQLDARAQTERGRKVEVGGHFTALFNRETDQTEPGAGGRVGYNVTDAVTLEAELNVLPEREEFRGGTKVQGLFGVKAGWRGDTVGLFAKVRPGFMHLTEGEVRARQDVVCVAVFPPPPGCVEASGVTRFNVDLGGVLEAYPSPRTILRFDLGDTIVRTGDFTLRGVPSTIRVPARYEHNLQAGVGFGFRF